MTNKLFIGNLAYDVTDLHLYDIFATIGKVLSVKVIVDRNTGLGKGYGFVEMKTEEMAKMAMNKLDGTQLVDRTITVREAKPQENRSYGNVKGRTNRW